MKVNRQVVHDLAGALVRFALSAEVLNLFAFLFWVRALSVRDTVCLDVKFLICLILIFVSRSLAVSA